MADDESWLGWKCCESFVEAGPQLILQLYIIVLPNVSELPNSINITGLVQPSGKNAFHLLFTIAHRYILSNSLYLSWQCQA